MTGPEPRNFTLPGERPRADRSVLSDRAGSVSPVRHGGSDADLAGVRSIMVSFATAARPA